MQDRPLTHDEVEDIERKLAYADACSDVLDLGGLLSRAGGLMFKWVQADVVTVILPGDGDNGAPLLHTVSKQPLLHYGETSLREECSSLLAQLDFAYIPGHELELARGPGVTPLHDTVRDGALYPLWTRPLECDGEVVGVLALFGYVDWELSPRTRRLIGAMASITARAVRTASHVEQLRATATTDVLTGALNRRGFDEVIRREVGRVNRTGRELSLLLIDLDHFKQINDTHGHPMGDEVLRAVAAEAAGVLRHTDVVARLGGDEFAVLLPEVTPAAAEAVGARIAEAAAGIRLGEKGISLSIGVAGVDTRTREPITDLYARADEALYASKRAGRGRISQAG